MKAVLGRAVWIGLVFLIGCKGGGVSDADVRIARPGDARRLMDEPGVVLLDVRRAEAYEAGHLPGAIHIYFPRLRAGDDRLTEAELVIVYAGGWDDPLSTIGAKELIKLGYSNVRDFKGGVEAWRESGGEVVEGGDR